MFASCGLRPHRFERTAAAVCGAHATCREIRNAPKEIRGRGGTKQAAGCFTFGYSGEGIGPPHPNIGIDGRQTRPLRRGPRGGKAVAFGRASHRSSSIVRFAALNPSARSITHAWAVGGDGVACSASSAFRVGWVEQSETDHAPVIPL